MAQGVYYIPISTHTTNSSLASAVTLTSTQGADLLIIQAATQSIRYRLDGTAPTSTTGFLLATGTIAEIPVKPGNTVKIIETTASASVQYQWAKQVKSIPE